MGPSPSASSPSSGGGDAPPELESPQQPPAQSRGRAAFVFSSKLLLGKLDLEISNSWLCAFPFLSVLVVIAIMAALGCSVARATRSETAPGSANALTSERGLVSRYVGGEFYARLPSLDEGPLPPEREGEYIHSTTFLRGAGSLRWFAALFLHLFVCIVTGCIAMLILIRSLRHRGQAYCALTAIATVGLAALVCWNFPVRLIYGWDNQFYLLTEQTHWLLAHTIIRDWGSGFQRILDLPARFTILVGVIVVVSFGTALFPRQDGGKSELGSVLERLRWNRMLLYSGAALLVGMLVQTSFLVQWALSYLYPTKDSALYSSLEVLTSSMAMHQGVGFTVLLAAAYLPTIPVLNGQVQNWALAAPEMQNKLAFERDKWLMDSGVIAAPADTVGKFVAVLTPLLVGSAGEIIKGLVAK